MFPSILLLADLVLSVSLSIITAGRCSVSTVNSYVNQQVSADKMQAYPFKVGDYNRDVQANYPGEKGQYMSLPYPDDVIAWIVIYNDKDTAWGEAPLLLRDSYNNVKQHFTGSCFNESSVRYIEANKMKTTDGLSLPVVHTQTAGHTAGGAYYYQRHHVTNEPEDWKDRTIFGLSAHGEFGLDTRFAGVIVFEDLRDSMLNAPGAPNYAKTESERIRLLNEYNSFGRK